MGQGEDQPPKELLDLPAWQGEEARELEEPEAVANVKSMRLEPIEVPGVGPVDTCFMSLKPDAPADAPPLLLIHGFDSSLLEFRYITSALLEAGLRGTPPHAAPRAAPSSSWTSARPRPQPDPDPYPNLTLTLTLTRTVTLTSRGDGVVDGWLHRACALHQGHRGDGRQAVGPDQRAPVRHRAP